MKNEPILYLIPNDLGGAEVNHIFPDWNKEVVSNLTYFLAEHEKNARRFIKKICPEVVQADLDIQILNKKSDFIELPELMQPLRDGHSMGIVSDAGMPGIADPGARAVFWAHQQNIQVKSLIGPSSIFLALASSGLSGQQFAFHGYLPIDDKEKIRSIKNLERESQKLQQTQIFMETPYRNNALLKTLLKTLKPNTKLCVACDLTLPTEWVYTGNIQSFKQKKADLHKRPALFLIQSF